MHQEEIEFTFLLGLLILSAFVTFIIIFVFVYKRRQYVFFVQRQLVESRLQNKLLGKELELAQNIQKERERISYDLHDDIGSRVSAMTIELNYFKTLTNEQKIIEGLDDLIVQSKELGDTMREIVWSLNSQYDSLESFVDFLVVHAEKFFSKTNIQLECQIPSTTSPVQMSSLVRRNLFLATKEALHNVFKHSHARNVLLNIEYYNKSIAVTIDDDGVGLADHFEKVNMNGLKSMEIRMSSIGGVIDMKSDKGIKIKLSIPQTTMGQV